MSVVCRNGHYQHLFWWLCWKNVPVSFLENLPRLGEVKIWGCAIIGTFWVIHLGTMMRLMELTKLVIPLLGENSSASITHQTSMWLDLGWCKGFLHFSISGKTLIWHAELEWNYNPWLLFFFFREVQIKKKGTLNKAAHTVLARTAQPQHYTSVERSSDFSQHLAHVIFIYRLLVSCNFKDTQSFLKQKSQTHCFSKHLISSLSIQIKEYVNRE